MVHGRPTQGTTLWVVDERPGKESDYVYVYEHIVDSNGCDSWKSVGSWSIDYKKIDKAIYNKDYRHDVQGITNSPGGGTDLWIVDSQTDRVYRFEGGTEFRSGSRRPSLTGSYELAEGNDAPRGIADPPDLSVNPAGASNSSGNVLVTGQVAANPDAISSVTVNGTPVSVVDPGGHYFATVPTGVDVWSL